MALTKLVYSSAEATTLLAAVDPTISRLGRLLLQLVLLNAARTLVSSFLVNNIDRQFPASIRASSFEQEKGERKNERR